MLPVRWNLAMATLGRGPTGSHQAARGEKFATRTIEQMAIKSDSPFAPVSSLSGGTQQKVVVGKFMATDPAVLLFVDSTRGIDVQTKFEFYDMLRELARSGAACVLYSSDTEELVVSAIASPYSMTACPSPCSKVTRSLWTPSLRRPSPRTGGLVMTALPEVPSAARRCDAGHGSLGSGRTPPPSWWSCSSSPT